MHIHPISGDEQHRCAVVASTSRLTLSNIDPPSRHPRILQVKLWATIWTLMPIGRTTARMCSAQVKRPNGGGARVRKAPGVGSPVGRLMFHVKRSDRRSLDSCQSVCSGCVAQFVRHVPCIPVPMRKRSNRADVKMKADLQRWLIESGEAEELVAFLREERARHPVPPPRVAVTTSLDVDIFDAMMARASSEGITSRSGALRAAVREWVRNVECQPEAHED